MLDKNLTTRPLIDTNVLCEFMYLFSTVKNLVTNCILLLIRLLLIYINIVVCNVGSARVRWEWEMQSSVLCDSSVLQESMW